MRQLNPVARLFSDLLSRVPEVSNQNRTDIERGQRKIAVFNQAKLAQGIDQSARLHSLQRKIVEGGKFILIDESHARPDHGDTSRPTRPDQRQVRLAVSLQMNPAPLSLAL
jgi:uncharacterized protein (DUF2461 family)